MSCQKTIDSDSRFCKYCGARVVSTQKSKINNDKLVSIFQNVCDTLCLNSEYTEQEFEDEFSRFKNYENRDISDNEYYRLLVDIIFYSGFKASTVDKYLDVIHSHFEDYEIVAKYNLDQVEEIKNDKNMIQNKAKIDACIRNAVRIKKIVEKYGSFKKYIDSFKPNSSDECLFKLKKSLEKNFSFIGGTTSYHFMTDIGLNVLKPDRVILRIFYRLGLIDNEEDLFSAVKVGRSFSRATKLPIRYIDIIFVSYGQLNQEKMECICSEKNPKCLKCGVKNYCNYYIGSVI